MQISLAHITKRYWRATALEDVTVEFPEGKIVAIVGANGAGKTTLLSILASLTAPNQGEMHCDGERFSRRRVDMRKRLFFLPDYPVFGLLATVIEYIGMLVSVYEVSRPGIEAEVVALLEEFDLLPQCDARLQRLSRGERYKAALVGMLTVGAEVMLIDEPFASGIDPAAIAAFRRHMRAHAARGGTVIYSTQIIDLAAHMSDLVCVLEKGRLAAMRPIDKLLEDDDEAIRKIVSALDFRD